MKENTSDRLKQLMNERKLKQVDILNLSLPYCKKYNIKMNKSDISQYVSGKVEPSQEKLVVLGMALNVSEAWLMGFDVSPIRKDNSKEAEKDVDLLWKFSMLEQRDNKIDNEYYSDGFVYNDLTKEIKYKHWRSMQSSGC